MTNLARYLQRRAPLTTALAVALPILLSGLLASCASTVPAPVRKASAPVVREGPRLPAATNTGPSAAGIAAPAPPAYTVKKGDTLHGIALNQGLDYRELAAWNNIDNPNHILVGQQLRVTAPDAAVQEGSAVASTQPVSAPTLIEGRPLEGGVNGRGDTDGNVTGGSVNAGTVTGKSTDTEKLKREPKGGKQPYSEAALARLQQAASPQVSGSVSQANNAEVAKPAAMPPAVKATQPPSPAAAGDTVDWVWPASGKVIATFAEGTNKGIDIAVKTGDPVLAAASGKVVYAGSGLRGYGKLVIVKHSPTFLSAYAHNSQILVKEGQSVARGQKIAEAGSTDSDKPQLHFEIRRQGKPVDPLKYLPGRAP